MTKKSLTDLLREEVEKSPELDSENVRETNTVENSQMSTPNRSSTRRSSPTKAELEATIAQLKAALEKAEARAKDKEETYTDLKDALEESHKKEDLLQQQISDLQSELQHHKESVNKLQKELKKLEPLKGEFEQAKKAAVQLAEANEKLTKEVKTLVKKESEDHKAQEHKAQEHKAQEHKAQEHKAQEHKAQEHRLPERQMGRPVQKESEKPLDFAKKEWLL